MISIVYRWIADGGLRNLSSAELIAFVTEATLASISAQSTNELERVGWHNNPSVDRLYKLGSTGLWCPKEVISTGALPIEIQMPLMAQMPMTPPTFDATVDTSQPVYAVQLNLHHKYMVVPIVVGGTGILADQVLLPAIAGKKICFRILGLISSIAEATTTIEFQDEDNTALEGNITGGFSLAFTAFTMNTQLTGCLFRATVAAKAMECDISGFAAGGTIIAYLEWWAE